MKLPEKFNWKYYLDKHSDLINAGLKTKQDAENHYLKYGQFEKREFYDIEEDLLYVGNINEEFDGVNIFGYGQSTFGLGHNMRAIVDAIKLTKIRFSVNIVDLSNVKKSYRLPEDNNQKYNTNLFLVNPDVDLFQLRQEMIGKYNIALWAWELESLPKRWIKLSKLFNEIWTISKFSEQSIKKDIQNKIIKVINIPGEYKEKKNKIEAKISLNLQNKFVTLFVFDGFSDINRKNPMAVIESFRNSIGKMKETVLVIKSQNVTKEEVSLYFSNISENILLINESWNKEKMTNLFNASDIYISLHRCEGSGLTIMEAIELEIPVVCTNYSGNLDFCDEGCQLVDFSLIPIQTDNPNYKEFNNIEKWAEVKLDDAEKKLTKVYENYDYYKSKIKMTKNKLLQKYNIYQLSKFLEKNLNNESIKTPKKIL